MGQYDWIIAVVIALTASTISNVGLNLQKKALSFRAAKRAKSFVVLVWTIGFVLMVAGALSDFAALGFGAQSIVAPLGAWTLVANVVLAGWINGEKLTIRDLGSTALIVAGCAISVATANHQDEIYTAEQLFQLYASPRFGIYMGSVVFVILSIYIAIRWMERVEAREGHSSPRWQRLQKLHRLGYPLMSGITGAQSVLFAKTVVELFTGQFVHHDGVLFARWESYPVILAMAATLTLQVYWMNRSLARYDALISVPVFQASWIVVGVVGGGVVYDEFGAFTPLAATLFPLGIMGCTAGVILLSQRNVESEQERQAKDRDAADAAEVADAVAAAAGDDTAAGEETRLLIPADGGPSAAGEGTPLLSSPALPRRGADGTSTSAAGFAAYTGGSSSKAPLALAAETFAVAGGAVEIKVSCRAAYLGLRLRRTKVKGASHCSLPPTARAAIPSALLRVAASIPLSFSLTHSLLHSLTPSLAHSFTRSLTHLSMLLFSCSGGCAGPVQLPHRAGMGCCIVPAAARRLAWGD